MDAQINGLQRKLLICKESENCVFCFPWSEKTMDGIFTASSIIPQSQARLPHPHPTGAPPRAPHQSRSHRLNS